MPLTKSHIAWMERVAKMKVEEAKKTAQARDTARQNYLKESRAMLDTIRTALADAQNLKITMTSDTVPEDSAWNVASGQRGTGGSGTGKVRYEMDWNARPRSGDPGHGDQLEKGDREVDTRADIGPNTESVAHDKIAILRDAHEKIVMVQEWMKSRVDETGQPLFSDDDIRREVWTPLVRTGVIPGNAVQDKYSEQAIAFAGAAKFYAEKLDDYSSKTSSAQEARRACLGRLKDVVGLTGSLAGGALTAANAQEIAANNNELIKARARTQKLQETADNTSLSEKERAQATAELREQNASTRNLSRQNAEMRVQTDYARDGAAIVLGALGTYEAVKEHQDSDESLRSRWSKTAETALNIAQTSAASLARTILVGQTQSAGENPGAVDAAANVNYVVMGINAGFSGAKMGTGLALVLTERDPKKREALLDKLVVNLADTIKSGIIAASNRQVAKAEAGSDDQAAARDRRDEYAIIAENVRASILAARSAKDALKALIDPNGTPQTVALHLVSAGLAAGLTASAKEIYKGTRKPVDDKQRAEGQVSERPFHVTDPSHSPARNEREVGQGARRATEGVMTALNAASNAISAAENNGSANKADTADDKMQSALDNQINDMQKATVKAALAEAFSADKVRDIVAEAEANLAEIDTVYSDAFPDPDVASRDPAEIAAARKAIDKATARTTELRMKVALVDGLSSAGTQVLASLVPGVGAVVAAQRLMADIYTLYRQVQSHNAWVQSMELAFVGDSAVAPAIVNTLTQCKVNMNVSRIKVILDGMGLGAEAGKVFDPTGATTVVSSGAAMLHALTNTCNKWYSERQMRLGWTAYTEALKAPGNRKKARQALRLNSTLAKCCVAYGATIMGDPVAKRAIAATGLSVHTLENDKDICVRVITYLETNLSDHPSVLKFAPTKKKWHPGTPELKLKSWFKFKAAANMSADPKLDRASLKTPGIDRCLIELAKLKHWKDVDGINYVKKYQADCTRANAGDVREFVELRRELKLATALFARLDTGFRAYAPLAENTSDPHTEMQQIVTTLAALAKSGQDEAQRNYALLLEGLESEGEDAQPVEVQQQRQTDPRNADDKTSQQKSAQARIASSAALSSADVKRKKAIENKVNVAKEKAVHRAEDAHGPKAFDKLTNEEEKMGRAALARLLQGAKETVKLTSQEAQIVGLINLKEAHAQELERFKKNPKLKEQIETAQTAYRDNPDAFTEDENNFVPDPYGLSKCQAAWAKAAGGKWIDVERDGNCLFHCLSRAGFGDHAKLRSDLAKAIYSKAGPDEVIETHPALQNFIAVDKRKDASIDIGTNGKYTGPHAQYMASYIPLTLQFRLDVVEATGIVLSAGIGKQVIVARSKKAGHFFYFEKG